MKTYRIKCKTFGDWITLTRRFANIAAAVAWLEEIKADDWWIGMPIISMEQAEDEWLDRLSAPDAEPEADTAPRGEGAG